jgi:hypothetical protein
MQNASTAQSAACLIMMTTSSADQLLAKMA